MRLAKSGVLAMVCSAALVAPGSRAQAASLIPVGPEAFPSGSPLITFGGLANGTVVNGLVVNNVSFQFTINGTPSSAAIIDGGPGTTNNINPPNIVNNASNVGAVLTVILPTPATVFGYGYAILSTVPVANATTVALFDGTTSLGSLSFNGSPDPDFTGGFAGVLSTTPFTEAQLTFSTSGAAFAADNFRYASTAVPEPASLVLLGTGLLGVAGLAWRARVRRDGGRSD